MGMRMTIEQAEKLLDDLATQEELLCKRADDASGYTRSGNESIRTSDAKTHAQHAKEYRQILRYLAEYRLMQADYENRLKADMVAMLDEIKEQLREIHENYFKTEHYDEAYGVSDSMDVIQQKISELEGSR